MKEVLPIEQTGSPYWTASELIMEKEALYYLFFPFVNINLHCHYPFNLGQIIGKLQFGT
jgi:hypothetical protein